MNIESIQGYVRKSRVDEGQDDSATVYVFHRDRVIVYLHVYDDGDIGLISEDYPNKKWIVNRCITKDSIPDEIELALNF